MQITLDTKPYATLETDALVTYVFEDTDPVQGRIAEIDQAAGGLLKKLAKSGEAHGQDAGMHSDSRACGIEGRAAIARRGREARAILLAPRCARLQAPRCAI